MSDGGNTVPRITKAEHIGPSDTGDNIEAKRVAGYYWDGSNWQRRGPNTLVPSAYDYISFTNPDANGNYQTITYKTGGGSGSTINTLTLGYDGNSKITSIAKS